MFEWYMRLCGNDPRAIPFMDWRMDIKNRLPYYKSDWTDVRKYGLRILAPATYTFFSSILPALAYGYQLAQNTEGEFSVVHVVFAGAMGGIIQTFIGGQPLAVIGIAQPIVTIITFQFQFLQQWEQLDRSMLVPWVAWTGVFSAIFLFLTAVFGLTRFIYRFTRFAGEVFGMLIAVLLLQEAVKGMISEFRRAPEYVRSMGIRGETRDPDVTRREDEDLAIMVNGLWALFLFFGMTLTSLAVDKAREARFGTLLFRRLLADYGVPFMAVVFTGLSYSLQSDGNGRDVPLTIPRRIVTPLLWEVKETWHVARRMNDIPGPLIAGALIPAIIVTILFWFDHGVSIKLGMPKELNMKKPAAFCQDQIVLALVTLFTALVGCPFPNAALPQCPMHTNSLATMRFLTELDERRKEQKEARALRKKNAAGGKAESPGSYGTCYVNPVSEQRPHPNGSANGQDIPNGTDIEDQSVPPKASKHKSKRRLGAVKRVMVRHLVAKYPAIEDAADSGDEEEDVEPPPPAVAEQRVSNLIQSLMFTVCLALMHVIQLVPTAVIWGYFAYMAINSFNGMQFWDRMMLVFTDRKHYPKLIEGGNHDYLRTVPYPVIVMFTAFQFCWTGGVWALVTWAGVGGVVWPVAVIILLPIRAYVMPKLMKPEHLEALDPVEKEEEVCN